MCLSFLDFVFHSQMIDRNSDGKLDLQDFALQGTITNVHYQKWTELRDKFDYDGDGMVTMEEVSALEKYEFLWDSHPQLIPDLYENEPSFGPYAGRSHIFNVTHGKIKESLETRLGESNVSGSLVSRLSGLLL